MKDQIASKKVVVNYSKASEDLSEDQGYINNYLTCFELEVEPPKVNWGHHKFLNVTRPMLPLHVIYPIFAPGIVPECVLDSRCQMIIMQQDVWSLLLDAPIMANRAIKMYSANSTFPMTMGMVENYPVKIGPTKFLLQIQVVADAHFEVLLGHPFFDVANCSEISQTRDQHIIQICDLTTERHLTFWLLI